MWAGFLRARADPLETLEQDRVAKAQEGGADGSFQGGPQSHCETVCWHKTDQQNLRPATLFFKCLHKPYYWPRAPGLFLKGSLPNIERHTRPGLFVLFGAQEDTASLSASFHHCAGRVSSSSFQSSSLKKKKSFLFFGLVMPKCNQSSLLSSLPTRIAHGTLLGVMRQPEQEGVWGRNWYMYMSGWVPSLLLHLETITQHCSIGYTSIQNEKFKGKKTERVSNDSDTNLDFKEPAVMCDIHWFSIYLLRTYHVSCSVPESQDMAINDHL